MDKHSPIKNVAIVGATGRMGGQFVTSLLAAHNRTYVITAITRHDSTSTNTIPSSVRTVKMDYSNPASLHDALEGQDLLIIALSLMAPPTLHSTIVQAASKAGVRYVIPSTYGYNIADRDYLRDDLLGATNLRLCQDIEEQGMKYIAFVCGFWYEWSLALGEQWFGFVLKDRTLTMFDDGETKVVTSTWEQCGNALVKLLELPVRKENGNGIALEDFENKPFFFQSFRISQRDMLDSLNRVLGTTDQDWKIKFEGTEKRVQDGKEEFANGVKTGLAKALYSRAFYPEAAEKFDIVNKELGLPIEELDTATQRAVKMVESGWTPF